MNGLSKLLNDSHAGCRMDGSVLNHLFYADDSCIMAPSPSGLQQLLNIWQEYARENTIIFNESKT